MNRTAVEQFARGAELLTYATDGLSADELKSRPGPGQWSTAEVVLHLMDSELVYQDRMKRIIAEDKPLLVAFDENRWATRLDYQSQPVPAATTLFHLTRRHMLELLGRLDDRDFERVGIHTERGRLTLAEVVSGAADHLDHHLRFIYAKRERLGRPVPEKYSGKTPERT